MKKRYVVLGIDYEHSGKHGHSNVPWEELHETNSLLIARLLAFRLKWLSSRDWTDAFTPAVFDRKKDRWA